MKKVTIATIISIFCLIASIPVISEEPAESVSYEGLKTNECMKKWMVLGPIPVSEDLESDEATQKAAFANDFLSEHGGESSIRPTAGLVHKIDAEEFAWQMVQSENDIVDLFDIYGEKEFVIAYAWAEIEVSEETKVLLGIGSDDGVKIWLNGELFHENWIGRAANKDDDIIGVTLKEGANQLLLKVQNQQFDWEFVCRAVSPDSLTQKIILATIEGDLDTLETFLSHGADVNTKDETGLTALHAAKIHGREDVVKFLLEKGADANIEMPLPEKLIDSIFEEATQGDSPGAAVLVAQDGEILYQKGFGFANIEEQIPVTLDTKFRIGSITKQFTAAAILELQEDGLLNVNDKLSKFIPDYPRGDEVTIYHLLGHTSGIHSHTSKPEFYKTMMEEVRPKELIESFKHDEFDFNPGEKWLYNNSGYFLLGYIVEKVSGESFGDYLKSHFFEPLEMKNTGVHSWHLNLENEASGYSYKDGEFHPAMKWDMSQAGGAGAIFSTVGDLYRWNEAVFNGKALSESSLKAAFTPVKLNDGSEAKCYGR